MLDLIFAVLAGILTIAAPCTLPMLPILFGTSIGRASPLRPAFIALGFVGSFSATALLLGALTRLLDIDPTVLRSGAAVLLLGFGALMLWPGPFEWIAARLQGRLDLGAPRRPDDSALGGLLLGTTLGLVWTPCAGPVLGSILTLIATSGNTAWSSVLLVSYAIGAALPMLAIAYGGQAATSRLRHLARITPRLQQAFGVLVIGFAVASYFQYDTLLVAWLTGFYPAGQIGL